MSDDLAQDTLERHHHLEHNPGDGHAKRAALVIGMVAAALALCEMGERGSQNAYLSHHIAASDEFAFYQSRQNRALVLTQSAAVLDALPPSETAKAAATAARTEAARLTQDSERGNGSQQILKRAETERGAREVSLHRYEVFELVTSVLQIAIVLCSVSVVTRLTRLLWVGGGVGALAALAGALTAAGAL